MHRQLALFTALLPTLLFASQYPPDYCHQTVRVRHDGPAVFASVGSGCLSAFVIGYRNEGVLAQSNPEAIDAIVIGKCRLRDQSEVTKQTVVRLGREWHGHGWLSTALSPYEFLPDTCYNIGDFSSVKYDYQFAFSDGHGHWDSRYGANYRVKNLQSPEEASVLQTGQDGQSVSFTAWDFIVQQMR